MAKGSRYRVPLRRRREQKTDYQARKAMIVSGKPRLVARSSLKNTVVQIIVAKPHGDEVLASAHSRELIKKYGWKAATGNIPAAYLTGLLCGLKAKAKSVPEAILDIGLVRPTKGSKVFSAMSGVVDAGVAVPHSEEKIVKERTRGFHIQDFAEGLGAPDEYAPQFSTYVANGVSPAKFGDHFFEVRAAVLTAYGVPVPKPEVKPVKVKKPEPKKAEVPKKGEVKPAKAEVKPAVAAVKAVEAKKSEVAPAKPAEKVEKAAVVKPEEVVEVKAKAEPEAKAEAEVKAKAKPKAKPVAKKVAPAKPAKAAKAKAVEAEAEVVAPEAEAVAEVKPAAKKAAAKPKKPAAKAKPAKKTGDKKA
jgi:large subunit ribosomal protein L18